MYLYVCINIAMNMTDIEPCSCQHSKGKEGLFHQKQLG